MGTVMRLVSICFFLSSAAFAQEPRLEWALRREPVYPQMARIAHVEGEVWITIELDPQGTIISLQPLSGHPILIQAAVESLRESKLICRDCDGKSAVFTVLYRFKMPDPQPVNRDSEASVHYLAGEALAPVASHRVRSGRCL
jgi:TonB family protein